MSPAGDQFPAPAQVVTQARYADLIVVTNPANTPVVNASKGFCHKRKGIFDQHTGLRLAAVSSCYSSVSAAPAMPFSEMLLCNPLARKFAQSFRRYRTNPRAPSSLVG